MTINKNFLPFAVWQAKHNFVCSNPNDVVDWYLRIIPPAVETVVEAFENMILAVAAASETINAMAEEFFKTSIAYLKGE